MISHKYHPEPIKKGKNKKMVEAFAPTTHTQGLFGRKGRKSNRQPWIFKSVQSPSPTIIFLYGEVPLLDDTRYRHGSYVRKVTVWVV